MSSVVDFLADGSDKLIIAELPDGKRSPSPKHFTGGRHS
jgi:hypothetical protein